MSYLYITQNELVNKIYNDNNFVIIDLRDEDHIGGHIINSVNIPASSFKNNFDTIINLLRDKTEVVLHCQESLVRSPRCAKILLEDFGLDIKVSILKGGFDQWVRRFWNTNLVEDYDDDYWYFKHDLDFNNQIILSLSPRSTRSPRSPRSKSPYINFNKKFRVI